MAVMEFRNRTTYFRETVDMDATLSDPNAVLELYPLAVRQPKWRDNKGDASITRVGCQVITSISTSRAGVEAIKLFRRRYSLGNASSELKRRFKSAQIDLQPLLAALARARMIRAIDGRVINEEPACLWLQVRHRISLAWMALSRACVPLVIRCCPVAWSHRILFRIRPGWPRRKQRSVTEAARWNLETARRWMDETPLDVIAKRYTAEQIRFSIDLDLLTHLTDMRVALWLRSRCTVAGLEYLDAQLAKGKGALLCCFHFSSSPALLVLILWLRGYSFTGEGVITQHNTTRPLPWENPELSAKLGTCGQVKWHTTVNFASALGICRTLARGGLGLVFPDGLYVRPPRHVVTYFGRPAAEYEPARDKLLVFGRVLEVNTGVAWICQQTEAPLIPVRMRRVGGARFSVEIGRELKLTRGVSVRETAVELFAELERQMKTDPWAWFYWHKLHKFSAEGKSK
jgi:lauroyl/myristoyl acyltransferase